MDAVLESPVACLENETSLNEATSTLPLDLENEIKTGIQNSSSKSGNDTTQAGEIFSGTVRGWKPPPIGTTMADQMDLLMEQVKMLAGEVAFSTSSLKRLSEQAANNPVDIRIQAQIQKLEDEIEEKKRQMRVLEQRITGTGETTSNNASPAEMQQANCEVNEPV